MSEEVLMLAVKNGELDKLSILFERYQGHLYNFFVRMTWDKELSADLTQNVFLRIMKYRHSYKEEAKFKPWLFQIARNAHADHFRGQKMQLATLDQMNEPSDLNVKEAEEREVDQEALLNQALAKLDVQDREILVLSKYQKMKYEQIAESLDITVASVKVKVHRAIKRLKTQYFELEKSRNGG